MTVIFWTLINLFIFLIIFYLKMITTREMILMTNNDEKCLNFLLEHRLIPVTRKCEKCNNTITIIRNKNKSLGVIYRCPKPCRSETYIFVNTFFENTKIPFKDLIDFIFYWSPQKCDFNFINNMLGIRQTPFVAWRNTLETIVLK